MPPPPRRRPAGDPIPNLPPTASHFGMVKLLADLLHHTPPSAWPPPLASPPLRSRISPSHVSSLLLLPASLSRPGLSRRFLLLLPPSLVSPLCLSLLALSFLSSPPPSSSSSSPHAASLLLSLASSSPSAPTSFSSLSHASSLSAFPPAATAAAATLLASSYLRLRRARDAAPCSTSPCPPALDAALDAIKQVTWVPSQGEKRIVAMISARSDWCISREHIKAVVSKKGSDAWWYMTTEELLPNKSPKKKLLPDKYRDKASEYRKGTDTMDVWFDSGSSWAGVLAKRDGLNFPADVYLEGSDQHRGWF